MPIYYDLIIKCPACIAQGKSGGKRAQWYHGNSCGGKIQIGDNAYLKCTSCGHQKHLKNWRYACEEHESDYKSTNSDHFANAASSLTAMSTDMSLADLKWFRRLIDSINDSDW